MEYTKKLPDKIAAIDAQWEILRDAFEFEKLKKIHRDVHSLCGSSGTYGHKSVSVEARQLEICLKSLVEKNSGLSTDDICEITRLLENLKTVIAAATR